MFKFPFKKEAPGLQEKEDIDKKIEEEKKKGEKFGKKRAKLEQRLQDIEQESKEIREHLSNLPKELEKRKKESDPLFRFWRGKPETSDLKCEEADFDYRVIKENPDQENPDQIKYSRERFTNYHDFLSFQKELTPDQRSQLVNSKWTTNKGGPNEEKWTSPATYSKTSFLDRLKEGGDLHKYNEEYQVLVEQARQEKIEDYFVESEDLKKEYHDDKMKHLREEGENLRTELLWLGREDEKREMEENDRIFNSGSVSREHLENIKIEKGKIKRAEFKDLEYASKKLESELDFFTNSLLGDKVTNDFESKLNRMAGRTGLSKDELREIYNQNKNSLIAEAKEEINKNTSAKAKIAKTLLKSGLYVGAGIFAGTSTVATLGLGGLVGASAIAGVRVLDRLITEKIGQKKLDAKVEEIKKRKTDEDKKKIKDRIVASISLKKKIEIERVNLSEDGKGSAVDRKQVINKYIEEQAKAGSLEVGPDKLDDYKKKMFRVIVGLDDIDRFNAQKEAEINKPSWFDKLKKFEDKLSGDTVEKKTISSAAIIAAGLAAREIPGIRQVLTGYVGWKLGGALADRYLNKEKNEFSMYRNEVLDKGIVKEGLESYETFRNYGWAVEKLVDDNFKKSDPEGYLKLKQEVEETRIQMVNSTIDAAKRMNDSLEEGLLEEKDDKKRDNIRKMASRVGFAAVGVAAGELIKSIGELRNHRALETDLSDKETISQETPPTVSPAWSPKEASEAPFFQQPDSAAAVSNSVEAKLDSLKTDSVGLMKGASPFSPDTVRVVPSVPENLPIVETGSEQAGDNIFEDTISNAGLKPGQHDSIWRSTEQMFKDNADRLGYKGDLNDQDALKHWTEAQTAQALNNSGEMTDKVFEGNRVILEQNADGNYQVRVEQAEGYKPGFLENKSDRPETEKIEEITDSKPEFVSESITKSIDKQTDNYEGSKKTGAEAEAFSDNSTAPEAVSTAAETDLKTKESLETPESAGKGEDSQIENYQAPDDGSAGTETSSETEVLNKDSETLDQGTNIIEGHKFNLNDSRSVERLLNTNIEDLHNQLAKDGLKSVDWEFDSKYSPNEQLRIKNYVVSQILETKEEQNLLQQYETKYGDRPEFIKFKKLVEGDMARDKNWVVKTIKDCASPGSNVRMTGGGIDWRSYKEFAQAEIDVMSSKARLFTLSEQAKMLSKELP